MGRATTSEQSTFSEPHFGLAACLQLRSISPTFLGAVLTATASGLYLEPLLLTSRIYQTLPYLPQLKPHLAVAWWYECNSSDALLQPSQEATWVGCAVQEHTVAVAHLHTHVHVCRGALRAVHGCRHFVCVTQAVRISQASRHPLRVLSMQGRHTSFTGDKKTTTNLSPVCTSSARVKGHVRNPQL